MDWRRQCHLTPWGCNHGAAPLSLGEKAYALAKASANATAVVVTQALGELG